MTTITDTHPAYVAGTWKLDPTHSALSFSLKHLMISTVRGTFDTFDVTVVTAENPTHSSVSATVEIASVNTQNADRDAHLRNGDFFSADEFPQMTFTSTSAVLTGDDFSVAGELTLKGVTKSVTLKGEFGGIVVDGYGQTKAGASLSTTIDRTDYGVMFNMPLEAGGVALGHDVKISIELQLVLQPAA